MRMRKPPKQAVLPPFDFPQSLTMTHGHAHINDRVVMSNGLVLKIWSSQFTKTAALTRDNIETDVRRDIASTSIVFLFPVILLLVKHCFPCLP